MDSNLCPENRFELQNHLCHSFADEIADDVFAGMTGEQKFLPSKYFYDDRGSALFEDICRQPEYYQTRTEMKILKDISKTVMQPVELCDVVELGSGANWKVRQLLDEIAHHELSKFRYIPVDVSEAALTAASSELAELYPGLNILGLVADFTKTLHVVPGDREQLILFFGGTIGNFTEDQSQNFISQISSIKKTEDRTLVGFDMIKEKAMVEAAYNDARGITAEFNKNILKVVNQRLNANFNLDDFEHLAFFNEAKEQIEMHLLALKSHSVVIEALELDVEFQEGETIHTEISRKFSRESAQAMFARGGLEVRQWFIDDKEWFSIVELAKL